VARQYGEAVFENANIPFIFPELRDLYFRQGVFENAESSDHMIGAALLVSYCTPSGPGGDCPELFLLIRS
jgi:hypothetical protein